MTPVVLVMARAPVPGRTKTRLGAAVGHDVAAELAAACLLDTLDVCEEVFSATGRHVALDGGLADATHGGRVAERLHGWTVHRQRGDDFAARLADAHAEVGRHAQAPVVQIGTDTPHLRAAHLRSVSERLGDGNDAVLGPAEDGGWWVLAVSDPGYAQGLGGVRMSTSRTYDDTLHCLRTAGATVATAPTMRDVDTAADAEHVARLAPRTRFARRWAEVR